MSSLVDEKLKLSDFDYYLPESLIAQEPCSQRDQSRLMKLDRKTGAIEHMIFSDIERFILPGDLLVLNDTKVFPCRLPAKKMSGGKAEILLVSEKTRNYWVTLIKGGMRAGKRLQLDLGIEAEITGVGADDTCLVRFHGIYDIKEKLPFIGRVPLPPYIKRDPTEADRERYQTVYASCEGAVAAPTAGLHFTKALLQKLTQKNVKIITVTLHVGPGTFQPVRTDVISGHHMLSEYYMISHHAAANINKAKQEGRRVIAVGTTSVRTIEAASLKNGEVSFGEGKTELFIHPGYRFNIIDVMITNFHLPKSTLLMLVCAFAGREQILAAYQEAVMRTYRFYSYGDAMIIT